MDAIANRNPGSLSRPAEPTALPNARVLALLKPTSTKASDDTKVIGNDLSGPDIFLQQPDQYFTLVKSLQQQIFSIGQRALGDIVKVEECIGYRYLPLRLLVIQWPMIQFQKLCDTF
jgi:hypothetical protein